MSNIKISQLPAATTPLAGTEEVPLVQSGATKKVSVANLRGTVVTAVTGTAPVVSSGGTTPAISMPAATGSVNGYLTSTDWNTFNNKQPAGAVTSVTGTAPVVSSGGTTPAISMAAASGSANGYLTSTDWTTFNSKQPAGSYLTNGGALGTPSSGTATNLTGLPLSTGVTGTLPVGNGGTGATTLTGVLKGNGTSAFTAATAGTDFVAPGGALGTPSSGTLTNTTGLPLTTGVTGLLPVANGGTGTATPSLVAGTNVTITGSWPNQTINSSGGGGGGMVYPGAGIPLSTGTAWGTSYSTTGTGNVVLSTSPTLVTPALGTPSSGVVTNLTGTASININGTVGATTANTGAFTTLSATGVTTVQAGTAAAPAITTSGDTNTGMFFPAADTIAFAEGGVEAMRLTAAGDVGIGTNSPTQKLDVSGPIKSSGFFVGSTGTSGFAALGTTGTATDGGNFVGRSATSTFNAGGVEIYTGGSERMRLDSAGSVGVGINYGLTNSRLVVAGQSPGGNGAYATGPGSIVLNESGRSSVNDIGGFEFKTSVFGSGYGAKMIALDNSSLVFGNRNNSATYSERMRLDLDGNLLIGVSSVGAPIRLFARGSGTGSGTYSTFFENNAGTLTFFVRDDGAVNTGVAALSPYNLTTGNSANVFVDSSGFLYRSTSSLKYKTDVQDAVHGLAEVMQLRPVTYKGKKDGDAVFGGLIAEEVHEIGLTEFVQYAKDGSPDALHYGNMVSLAFKAIQELKAEFDAYKATHP